MKMHANRRRYGQALAGGHVVVAVEAADVAALRVAQLAPVLRISRRISGLGNGYEYPLWLPSRSERLCVERCRMTQILANVERAVTDARDALLTAEKERAAALTAIRVAEADVNEAREVLIRLERLRDRIAGDVNVNV